MVTEVEIAVALADIVREALANGESVHVEGLGTFSVQHNMSRVDQSGDGEIVLKPPSDTIAFSAE